MGQLLETAQLLRLKAEALEKMGSYGYGPEIWDFLTITAKPEGLAVGFSYKVKQNPLLESQALALKIQILKLIRKTTEDQQPEPEEIRPTFALVTL